MWRLRVPLLWALLSMARGDPQTVREVSARLGSEVLLPLTQRLPLTPPTGRSCDRIWWTYDGPYMKDVMIAESRRCHMTTYNIRNVSLSENGSLILSGVTAGHAGRYTATVHDYTGGHIHTATYRLHVEAPVSDPVLDIRCLRDGGAQISCRVDDGSHYTMYMNVTGPSEGRYSSSSNHITVTVPDPGSVTCMAENRVSRSHITGTWEACPVPLSGIAVSASCLPDGNAEAVCWVLNGSHPRFSWSLDGKSQEGSSNSSHSRVTLPPPVSGTLRCDVINVYSNLSDYRNVSCPVPVSVPDISVSCLWNCSAVVSCEVKSGTDPSISLTISGASEVYHVTGLQRRVSTTVPFMASPGNVSCFVRNHISNSSASETHACPVASDKSCDCRNKSLIGASVVLIAALPLYVVAYWRALSNVKKTT